MSCQLFDLSGIKPYEAFSMLTSVDVTLSDLRAMIPQVVSTRTTLYTYSWGDVCACVCMGGGGGGGSHVACRL